MKTARIVSWISMALLSFTTHCLHGQLMLSGQVRTRTELRQGQGTLPNQGAVPAFFTSQRTRLTVSYTGYRIKFFTALQDVRVWGQDQSTQNRNTIQDYDGLMLHEAWAEISLIDTSARIQELALKTGRQELVYNDHRLLGNLDWMQQARRHDIALVKFAQKGWTVHAGAAYNQNKENKAGTIYLSDPTSYPAGTNGIGSMYKSLQFIFISKKWNKINISLISIKDDFNKYTLSGAVKTFERGVWSRITTGYHTETTLFKKANIIHSAYYQTGKDKTGKKLSAYFVSIYTTYALNSRLTLGPGFDFASGNNALGNATVNHAFDPLYGTPHKFWGYMDYFYVADGFGNGGLIDYYLKYKHKMSDKFYTQLDLHEFYSANKIAHASTPEQKALNPRLGTEIDFLCNYTITNAVNIEAGYGLMLGTNTLDQIKTPGADNKNIGHWAYVMVNIKPAFLTLPVSKNTI